MKKTLCLILVLTALFCAGCSQKPGPEPKPSAVPTASPKPTPKPTLEPTPEPTLTPSTELAETEDRGQDYIDSFVFYGDSNTNGMRLLEVLPGGYNTTQVWTPMSGTLTLCFWDVNYVVYPETWTEMPVTEAMETKNPEYLLVNLGANGISFMDEEYFKSEYTEMVEALSEASPDTKIILSSIFPVANSYPYQADINNDKIEAANGWIYEIAEDTGTRFIDCSAALRGADGSLPETLHGGDGLHLTAEGYELVLNYIRTHGWQ